MTTHFNDPPHREVDDDSDEFQLRPGLKRPVVHESPSVHIKTDTCEPSRLGGGDGLPLNAPEHWVRQGNATDQYNSTSGTYPNVRHYPTLESMQRLYKLFGYVTIGIVFPYLGIRLVYLLFTTEENLLFALGVFSEFAVPLVLLCVAATATLFGAAEGIRLMMDLQDNTLRLANHHDRIRR